jgi:N-hydroxyarylamine O-acetyltransferase
MITPQLVEQVLAKLGLQKQPGNDLAGLETLYGRWCRKVPFDNLQKRLFFSDGGKGPLPGNTANNFFRDWLAYGTGGTCWAVSHALHDLLQALGFEVQRASGTMLISPTVRGPNHGTVVASLHGAQYLIDGSMLTEHPLPLKEGIPGEAQHPAAQIQFEKRAEHWQFFCRPLHLLEGVWCRIDATDVSVSAFDQYYEGTRAWSPFNFALYARINTQDQVTGIIADQKIAIEPDGQATSEAMQSAERVKFLVEQVGIAEEIIAKLPADEPLPPRPV